MGEMVQKTVGYLTIVLLLIQPVIDDQLFAAPVDSNTPMKISELSTRQVEERIASSKQYLEGRVISELDNLAYYVSYYLALLYKSLFFSGVSFPDHIPIYRSTKSELQNSPKDFRSTWFGHSMLLIEIGHIKILTDPVFSGAGPQYVKNWIMPRHMPSSLAREEMPVPDVILISHGHYDHLEYESVLYFAQQGVLFLVPIGLGAHLEAWGVKPSQIREFDWWESFTVGEARIIATPAKHASSRWEQLGGYDSLWVSWVIESPELSVFYSGDTAYGSHFQQIGDKLGPFNVTFIETTASNYQEELMGHLPACDTIQAHKDLRGEVLIPVHWGTFDLFLNHWEQPIEELTAIADKTHTILKTPMPGEPWRLGQSLFDPYWWVIRKKKESLTPYLMYLAHPL